MMAVAVSGSAPSLGAPRELFRGDFYVDPFGDQSYDVAPDGRFLMFEEDTSTPVRIQVIVDWGAELKRLLAR